MPSRELQNDIKCDVIYSVKVSFKLIGSVISVINLIVLLIPQFELNAVTSTGA